MSYQAGIMSELCPVPVPLEVLNETQAKTSSEAFLSFLAKKQSCDVTFLFENSTDKIEAHQCFLRARSPVFDSMFRTLGSCQSMREVKIEYASPEIVNKFLQFIYADKFDVTTVQALHLFQLGLTYNVEPLVEKCEALIGKRMSTGNAIEIYETAEKYGLMDLKSKAGDIIARSLKDFLQHPKRMKVKGTTLIALLKRTDLTVKETDLFQLALKWGRNNSSGDHELAVALADILPHICFTNMTAQEFTSVVWPTKLISLEDTGKILVYINGDGSTRNAVLPWLKFDTSMRNVKVEAKFEKRIRFVAEREVWAQLQKASSNDPFKECISFSTKVSGLSNKGKTFKIKSVSVTWPTRGVTFRRYHRIPQPPVNFRVLVMTKRSHQELYTTKFDTVFYECNNIRYLQGRTKEIAVEPPVEILDEFDYCISVVDEYPCETERAFTYHHGHYEITEKLEETLLLSDTGSRLSIGDLKRNDCPQACATSGSYSAVHVIRDICIAMD